MPQGIAKGPGAVVLQEQTSPLQFLMAAQEYKQKQAAAQAELIQKQKNARDKDFKEYAQFDMGKIYEPFAQQGRQMYGQYQDWINKHYMEGTESSPIFESQVQEYQRGLSDWANKAQAVESKHKEVLGSIQKNEFLDDDYYLQSLNDQFFNPDGSARNMGEISLSNTHENTLSDMGGYKIHDYTKQFWDNADNTVFKTIEDRYNQAGIPVKSTIEHKYRVYRPVLDENMMPTGEFETNTDGSLKVNVDDDVLNAFQQDKLADRWLDEELERRGFENTRDNKKLLVGELSNNEAYLLRSEVSRAKQEGVTTDKELFDSSDFKNRMAVIDEMRAGNEDALARARNRGTEIEFEYPTGPGLEDPDQPVAVVGSYLKEVTRGSRTQLVPTPFRIELGNDKQSIQELNNLLNEISPAKQDINSDSVWKYVSGGVEDTGGEFDALGL